MSVLRVLLPDAPSATRDAAWVLFDDADRAVERGRGPPARWPSASRREAVLAAAHARVLALTLPPMPASRVAAAAAYALEDRLASTDGAPAIAAGPASADGRVLAAVAARATVDAIAAVTPRFARIVAEPSLAPVTAGWAWYASGGDGGFVRTADGGAFAVDAAPAPGPLPAELSAALAQAARAGTAPRAVVVAGAVPDDALAAWNTATGIAFERASPWQWDTSPGSAFSAAPDLAGGRDEEAAPRPGALARALRPAALVAAAALALHVVATIAQWAWLEAGAWRNERAIVEVARGAGVNVGDGAGAEAALAALAARDAALRHRAAQYADADALPLLARAAPALAALAPGAVKSATYSTGAWTIDLAAQDDASQAALDRRLREAGLAPLVARTSAGHRLRIVAAP